MKKNLAVFSVIAAGVLFPASADAQFRNRTSEEEGAPMTES